jgi:hypothetical protein
MSDIFQAQKPASEPNFALEIDCLGIILAYYPRSILSVKKGLFLKVPENAV